MKYMVYVNRKYLTTKRTLQGTLDLLCEIFVPRTSFMVIEDDGKSSFPIIFIQNQQDLDKLIENNGKQLTF